jgi:hypothetical protein
VTFIPILNTARVETLVPGFDGTPVGLEEIVLGLFLIAVASVRPARFAPLVWLLIAFSVIRGIGHDLYMIASGYSLANNLVFIALHLAIIVSGVLVLRRARRRAPQSAETSSTLIDRATQAA